MHKFTLILLITAAAPYEASLTLQLLEITLDNKYLLPLN